MLPREDSRDRTSGRRIGKAHARAVGGTRRICMAPSHIKRRLQRLDSQDSGFRIFTQPHHGADPVGGIEWMRDQSRNCQVTNVMVMHSLHSLHGRGPSRNARHHDKRRRMHHRKGDFHISLKRCRRPGGNAHSGKFPGSKQAQEECAQHAEHSSAKASRLHSMAASRSKRSAMPSPHRSP